MNNIKYLVTGLFVLGGIVLLAVLIIWFEGISTRIRGGYEVRGHLANSLGIRQGKRVHRDGLEIGEVVRVESSLPREPGVWVIMWISQKELVPADARFVVQTSAVGDVFLDFESREKPSGETLPTDGTARVFGEAKAPTYFPEELLESVSQAADQLKGLKEVIANLKELTEPRTAAEVQGGKARNLPSTLDQFSETARSLQKFLDEPEANPLLGRLVKRADELKDTLDRAARTMEEIDKTLKTYQQVAANVNQTLASAQKTADVYTRTGEKADQLIDRLAKEADQAGRLITELRALVQDLRDGRGTAGKLVTDDELYRVLTTLTENLNTLADETTRLVVKLRKEGFLGFKPEE